jgi:xanthine/uracil permease
VTLIIGAADYTLRFGDFALNGIALGTFGAIILYQIFGRAPAQREVETPADAMPNVDLPADARTRPASG